MIMSGAKKRAKRAAPVAVEAPSAAVRSALMAATHYHIRGHVNAPCEMYSAEKDLKGLLQRPVNLGGTIKNYPKDMVLEALERQKDKVCVLVNLSPQKNSCGACNSSLTPHLMILAYSQIHFPSNTEKSHRVKVNLPLLIAQVRPFALKL